MAQLVRARVKAWESLSPEMRCCQPPPGGRRFVAPGEELTVDMATAIVEDKEWQCSRCGKDLGGPFTSVEAFTKDDSFTTVLELLDLDEGEYREGA